MEQDHVPALRADRGLRCSKWGALIFGAYCHRRLRRLCIAALHRLEGGEMYSVTLRRILLSYHGVEVGAYSYGECMVPGSWPAGVKVGRYVSIAREVQVFLRDHPLDHLSLHPFFYNSSFGCIARDAVPSGHLEIGHDAWLGAHSIITSKCTRIGIGAVVGAGSIVTKDVPDFAVVAGNPARILKYRFPEEIRRRVIASHWWDRPISDCVRFTNEMTQPVTNLSHHSLLDVSRREDLGCPTTSAPTAAPV